MNSIRKMRAPELQCSLVVHHRPRYLDEEKIREEHLINMSDRVRHSTAYIVKRTFETAGP